MKQIILIFCLGFILNSCKEDPLGPPNGDADVTFELKFSSSSSPNTRSIGDVINNDKIDYITVLVFEEGGSNKYLYRRSEIIPVDNQFTVDLLQTNDPIRIHVFINPDSNVDSVNYNDKTETEVINGLVTDLDLNDVSTDTFPMHGSLSLTSITNDMTVNNTVYLLRAMARVDMNTSAIPENIFKLEGVFVYKTPNRGRWVSDYVITQNGNPAAPTATAATLPPSFTTINTVLSNPVVVIDNKIENQLFVYENDANSSPVSRIVLAGLFNSETETAYYPIDFESQNKVPIDILRNHHYTVNITAITGSGYTNAIDAANGESIDISADITVWSTMGVDGSIDPEMTLTMPSRVLLNHINNNGSYTRIVPYSSNRDVTLYIDGVEVPFPGNNATVDLNIPTAQGSWLATATWNPTNQLEGELEFTHSTSNYNNAESYIVTLKNGGITRNLEVFVNAIDIEVPSNCYIVPMSGKSIIIPTTDQINTFWGTNGDGNVPNNVISSGTEWYAEVIWADFDYSNKITINQDGATASDFGVDSEGLGITVETLTTPGNVIIGLKKKGATTNTTDYLWSWHLWITDYDPDSRTNSNDTWAINKAFDTAGGQVHSYSDKAGTTTPFWSGDYNGSVVMDRNLGAIVSTSDGGTINYAVGIASYGMHYQWGRKDPYPYSNGAGSATVTTYGKATSWPDIAVGAETKAYSINNPHQFIKATNPPSSDWQAQDDNSWNANKGVKSLYDPCPHGWKVLLNAAFSNFEASSQVNNSGSITYGRVYNEGDITAWYPASGFLFYDSGERGWNGQYGTYWSSSHASTSGSLMYYWGTDGITLNYPAARAYGFSVRCLQE